MSIPHLFKNLHAKTSVLAYGSFSASFSRTFSFLVFLFLFFLLFLAYHRIVSVEQRFLFPQSCFFHPFAAFLSLIPASERTELYSMPPAMRSQVRRPAIEVKMALLNLFWVYCRISFFFCKLSESGIV